MRAFIAISLPEETKALLAAVQQKLAASGADVKWVEPENIHLTLKFLGEIDRPAAENIASCLDGIGSIYAPFQSSCGACGAFPDIRSARVLWAGLLAGADALSGIAQEIEERLAGLGIAREDRPFSCHITLGRARSRKNAGALAAILKEEELIKENDPRATFPVREITLFRSTLTPQGARYEILHRTPLSAR